MITGSFADTGTSSWIEVRRNASISLVFNSVVGSVTLERRFNEGDAKSVEVFTDDYEGVIEEAVHQQTVKVEFRLNCTAHDTLASIEYIIG